MKYINKFMFLLVASLSLLTACQDEAEVGDLLYPVEASDPSPKLYVYTMSLSGMDQRTIYPQTPAGIEVPTQTLSFSVKLSKPVSRDVVVSFKESPELAAEYNSDFTALPEGTVTFEPATLTIPAGATETTEPVVISVTNREVLENLEGSGVIAITFEADGNDVKTSTNNGAVYWTLTKEILNIYQSDADGLTEIPKSEWTLTGYAASYITEIYDDNVSNYNYGMIGSNRGYITYDFGSPRTIQSWQYLTPTLDRYRTSYGIGRMRVETSDDGTTWESHGAIDMTPASAIRVYTGVKFYVAPTCRYLRISPLGTTGGSSTASVYVGEAKVYE